MYDKGVSTEWRVVDKKKETHEKSINSDMKKHQQRADMIKLL